MVQNFPVFVDDGKKTIHLIGNIFKVGRKVIPDIDWLFAVTSPELGDVRDSRVI